MCERCGLLPSRPEEMPRPTVELAMQDKLVRAYLRSVPPKQARRFLRALFEEIAEEHPSNVVPFLHREAAEVRWRKERGAIAWARSRLPVWLIRDGA